MKHPAGSRIAAFGAAMAVLACSHSDPFPTGPDTDGGPFSTAEPVRLTFSTTDDGWPTFSADGAWISYRFARGTTDRDFCAGILPGIGGQRVAEVCAWELDDATRSDDFRSYLFVGGDRVVFTRHWSGTGNQSPQEAGLYLGRVGHERDAAKVLDLLGRPTGASDTWSYLIDPIWLGEDEILTLASKVFIGQTIPFGPVDTVYQGVEIARIGLGSSPAAVTPLVPAPNAVAWAIDQAAGTLYYHRRFYSAPPGSGASDVVADTIFRVPLTGGAPEAVYGRTPVPGAIDEGMEGFALLSGRVFVTIYSVRQPAGTPVPPPETRSELLEVHNGGVVETSHVRLSNSGDRWTRLSASADGRHLVVASVIAGQKDLHLFEVDP